MAWGRAGQEGTARPLLVVSANCGNFNLKWLTFRKWRVIISVRLGMKTSQTIKRNQQYPPEVLGQPDPNRWLVAGTGDVHLVTRSTPRRWTCDCPAVGLCRHIEAVAGEVAANKGLRVSFWTSEEDAVRQRRGRKFTARYEARGRSFWVTVRRAVA